MNISLQLCSINSFFPENSFCAALLNFVIGQMSIKKVKKKVKGLKFYVAVTVNRKCSVSALFVKIIDVVNNIC